MLWEAGRMLCPLCGQRKARRGCPALNQTICAVCCGTKRITEIACPADCGYLASAREHPAAVVRRQHERDLMAVLPTVRDLSARQQHPHAAGGRRDRLSRPHPTIDAAERRGRATR